MESHEQATQRIKDICVKYGIESPILKTIKQGTIMKKPNINTTVKHSESKDAWNIIGTDAGGKYKIARVPYYVSDSEVLSTMNKMEALEHAVFISDSFNDCSNK